MKREDGSFFANLFGGRGSKEEGGTSADVLTTASAQPHVLRERMKEKQLSHGETVTVNMSPVRLEAALGKMYLYFCPMQTLDILKTHAPGDGGDLPSEVVVEGLKVNRDQKPGLYTLKNVRLTSNGTMQVVADEQTVWEEYV